VRPRATQRHRAHRYLLVPMPTHSAWFKMTQHAQSSASQVVPRPPLVTMMGACMVLGVGYRFSLEDVDVIGSHDC
jgi:hypothetical protein